MPIPDSPDSKEECPIPASTEFLERDSVSQDDEPVEPCLEQISETEFKEMVVELAAQKKESLLELAKDLNIVEQTSSETECKKQNSHIKDEELALIEQQSSSD